MNGKSVAVSLVNVRRHFGNVKAVDDVSLDVYDGEFFSMLGPSGSGKTTCLRLVAGFERASDGRILLHGKDVSGVPPYDRDVNTVFQDYALFPHMTVAENVAYGLMIKKVAKPEREKRVREMLELVRLPGLDDRKPSQLSGGQRQRVALARALVNHPSVLLLDEPLGALDLKLRQQMQIELKAIQQQVGITFLYVTHDQEEALTMSDRLAVFNHGKIEQVGTPAEVYERPATTFVAGFVGTSNVINPDIARQIVGEAVTASIRPEKIHIEKPGTPVPPDSYSVLGTVQDVVYLGMYTRYLIELETTPRGYLAVVQQNLESTSMDVLSAKGGHVQLIWRQDFTRVLQRTEIVEESGV
ncbi:MAG: ABC transporter ATP-binding protein [Chloroflexi bacterium]|nr:ABC transporter ATP-binding protein [Chloroflexota bacterium]